MRDQIKKCDEAGPIARQAVHVPGWYIQTCDVLAMFVLQLQHRDGGKCCPEKSGPWLHSQAVLRRTQGLPDEEDCIRERQMITESMHWGVESKTHTPKKKKEGGSARTVVGSDVSQQPPLEEGRKPWQLDRL